MSATACLWLSRAYSETRQQRCWVHKTANILNELPKSKQGKAKAALQEIWMAESRKAAEKALEAFVRSYQAKYPKAVSPAGRMAPPMVGVMTPLKSVEIGVSNRVKIGRFLIDGGHTQHPVGREDVSPFAEVQIAGHHGGCLLVTSADEVVDVLIVGRPQGLEAKIVDDKQGDLGQLVHKTAHVENDPG